MPNENIPQYEPLTAQEKQAILDRHHQVVDQLNQTLGGALHYEDDRILRQMEDPKEVAVYRMHEEHVRREAERERIYASLVNQYGRSQLTSNPMARTFKSCLRLGDDPKDKEYNEKLYQEYISNPQKIVYREYSKLFNVNPKTLYDIGSDKQAMAEFYMNNTALCEDAYAFVSVAQHVNGDSTKVLYNGSTTMKKPIETMNEFGNTVKFGGVDGFACPTLTQQQAEIAMASPMFANYQNPELRDKIMLQLDSLETPHDFFQKFIDYGINIDDPDFLVKYKAVKTDPENGQRREVSFDKLFEEDDPNVRIEVRSKEEIFQLRAINRAFQDRYAEKFQSRIATRLNKMIFDANQIEKDYEGGWFERNLLKSTSPEWTEFIQAFKEFNDPNHENYLRKDVLRPKAQAYLDHKRDQGYESLADMKGTSLKRGTLCQACIDECDELDRQEAQIREDINIEINTGLQGKVGLIINAEEVDIFGDSVENNEPNELEKEKLDTGFYLDNDDDGITV